ncbi:hypothetical protein [Luteolibacter sp. LG18]|uniref:hypothetical protein n=1 Tax=Luteolibacter sp. LG18 TaxID=2819286 RepID=UPI002B312AC2|nr:hypothetical protein llg_29500 [Luteolibacter sp. LG18]
MQPASTPFHPIREGEERKPRTHHDLLVECARRTAEALRSTGAATDAQISAAFTQANNALSEDRPVELLECVARAQGYDEEFLGPVIGSLSEAVASTLSPAPPLIPFAGKLIAPSAFYESFESLHKLARVLLSPVIFAEDTDAVGVASINPIAALLMSEEVLTAVDRRFDIKPFLTVARMDYESWTFLTRKHFGL